MHDLGGSFRALISPFMRIFGRPQVKLEHPLFSHDGDSQEMQRSRLLMLYGKYLPVAELDEKCAELKKSSKAFEDARKYNHITAACNSDEYKTNGRRIDAIHQELDELYESSEEGTLDLDSEKTARVSSLKSTLVQLRRQRTRYRNRMNEMKDSLSTTSFTQTKDYEELSEFFDGINIKHIEEIEQFHKGITRIMRARLKEEIEDTDLAIELLDKQIDDVRAEIDEAGPISSLPKVALDRVGELTAELTHLNEANAAFERTAELKNQLKVMKRRCDSEKMDSFSQIESRINKEIEELNNRAVGPDKTSPLLEIKNPKSYNFIVPKDGGAGSKNRAVFLFDITLLAQTALPLVVHDSVGLKQIEDKNTVGLLNAYAGSTKQVFVAIDKAESYFASGETPEVIKDNTVLELSEGNELFGWSWNTNEGKRQ